MEEGIIHDDAGYFGRGENSNSNIHASLIPQRVNELIARTCHSVPVFSKAGFNIDCRFERHILWALD